MANADMVIVGPSEHALLTELYNQVFTPGVEENFLRDRFRGRHNISMIVAVLDKQHVGFNIGFELTPMTYYSWIAGVLPDFRRLGMATQLIQAQQAWASDHHYQTIRFECQNQHRPMLHLAISEGYDLVGIRWDTATANNVVIFEKEL